jgi:hypothetical protein
MTAAKSPGAVAAHGASEIDGLGRHVVSETSPRQICAQAPIFAALVSSDRCEAEGIAGRGSAPVFALCRALVVAGFNPGSPLEAWRGDTLCLRIRSIGESVGLRVASHGIGFERILECTGASPIRETVLPFVEQGASYDDAP